MLRSVLMLVTVALLSACGTQMKVVQFDPQSGYLPLGDKNRKVQPEVLTSKSIDMAKHRDMVLVTGSDWLRDEIKILSYFTEVAQVDDLQKLVVREGLQDKVPSIQDQIGLNKLYKAYKPFLWVAMFQKNENGRPYMRMEVTNPETLENVFEARIKLDYAWEGVYDQNSRYPLFNAYLDWHRQQLRGN